MLRGMLIPLTSLVVLLPIGSACPTGTPAEGEGEGEGVGEGEGEGGEGEGESGLTPAEPIEVGAPPANFDTSPPSFVTDTSCSTGQWWQTQGGAFDGERMHPGDSCIDCHRRSSEGPTYAAAGTVMGAQHDGVECRGIPGVLVELLDGNDSVLFSATTNDAGNFHFSQSIGGSYRARLTYEGRTREMEGLVDEGDCMSCHTATGENGAPGRIVAP